MLTRVRFHRSAAIAALAALGLLAGAGEAWATTVSFTTAPVLGNLSGVTLNGQAQTTTTTWDLTTTPFQITSGGTNGGWNVIVKGHAAGGSAVFKQYCPPVSAPCGPDASGYVAGGYVLPADSFTIDTTNAGWTSGGTTPAYQCSAGCNVDSGTAVKVISASSGVALGTWQSSGSALLSLSTPTTLHKLQTNEVYRVDLIWTLSTGP